MGNTLQLNELWFVVASECSLGYLAVQFGMEELAVAAIDINGAVLCSIVFRLDWIRPDEACNLIIYMLCGFFFK